MRVLFDKYQRNGKWIPQVKVHDVYANFDTDNCNMNLEAGMISYVVNMLFNSFNMPVMLLFMRLIITGNSPSILTDLANSALNYVF
jgi:hypothetical protein